MGASERTIQLLLLVVLGLGLVSQIATYNAMNERLDVIEGKLLSLEHRPVIYESTSAPATDFSGVAEDALESVVRVRAENSEGSGVIYDKRGYILTNRHVIDESERLRVIDSTGRTYTAELLAVSEDDDLAVLKITPRYALPTLDFAPSADVKIGTHVMALGNPKGMDFSVSQGIVSAQERWIKGAEYIQTDVSINPGSSGGPLVNTEGQIVGINTLKMRNAEGLSFAIPSDVAKAFAEETKEADQTARL